MIGASSLARKHNISDLAIGLTVVAFGTSAPQLVVNVFAAIRGHQDFAFGNVIGSNIFMILGVSSLINPLQYDRSFNIDYFLGIGTVALFIMMFTGSRKKPDRLEVAILLAAYVIFTLFFVVR